MTAMNSVPSAAQPVAPAEHASVAPPAATGLHIERLVLQGSRDTMLAPRFAQALHTALAATGWPRVHISRLTLNVSGVGQPGGPGLESLAQQVVRELAAQRGTLTPGGPQ